MHQFHARGADPEPIIDAGPIQQRDLVGHCGGLRTWRAGRLGRQRRCTPGQAEPDQAPAPARTALLLKVLTVVKESLQGRPSC
jgi:hypothetical protein